MSRASTLPAYVPGKAAAPGGLKLSSNELPFDPLPSVLAAVQSASAHLMRYPDHRALALRARIAARHGLDPSWVAVGAGSVGLLQQLCLAFAGPGDEVAFGWRSFEAYPVFTALAGAEARTVPLHPRTHAIDLDALAPLVSERTRLVLIADPNNPSGTTVGADELERFMDAVPPSTLVVLDRAYHEFVTAADAFDPAGLLAERPNVCVLRTFSKAHGLAALRVGYLLGRPEIVDAVDRTLLPFAVNGLGQAAALAALEPAATAELDQRVAAVLTGRSRLAGELRLRGIPVADPQGNFVWVPGLAVEPEAIATRVFPEGTRITVGTDDDIDRLLAGVDALGLPSTDAPRRSQEWIDRLDAAERRLTALVAGGALGGLTEPDAGGDERWEWGQAWAHVAEFGAYWLRELDLVLGGAAGFGRTKKDPHRIAMIEEGRATDAAAHLATARQAMARLRRVLAGMDDADWAAASEHPTLGRMDVDAFLTHFLVGHYEEHATQLEALR
jgi:histidinol-phosphate aminotransferase